MPCASNRIEMSLQSLAVRPELVQIGAMRRSVEWLPCKEFEFSDECSMVSVQARMGSYRRAVRDRRDDFYSGDRAGGAVRVFSVVVAENSVILLGHDFTVAGEFFRQLLESRSSRTLPFVTLPSRRLPRARSEPGKSIWYVRCKFDRSKSFLEPGLTELWLLNVP